jgi:hypothetical protein
MVMVKLNAAFFSTQERANPIGSKAYFVKKMPGDADFPNPKASA